ncbi:MAG: hypothetical protein ACH36H_12885 [Candidatus Nanopelagicales bacterium]
MAASAAVTGVDGDLHATVGVLVAAPARVTVDVVRLVAVWVLVALMSGMTMVAPVHE